MAKQRRIVGLMALTLAMLVAMLDATITNIALPDIMTSFKSTLNDTSWISTSYVMGIGVFMITASKLADQFGRKKLMIIGLILFGVSSVLCGMASSLTFLIIMRAIQSIGGAIITPIVLPMALALYGKEKMRTITSLVGAVTALAAAGGPALGGFIIQLVGWRAIFFINPPIIVLTLILTAFCIDETYDNTVSKRVDFLGVFLLTATLFPLIFALLKGQDYGWHSGLIISMFAGSAVALILFLLTEKKVKAPMLELGLFRETTFTASDICYMISGFGIVCPALIVNYFLQNVLGYTALRAALVIMWASATVIVSMPLGSVIANKLGSAKAVNVLGNLIIAVGIFLLARLKVSTPRSTMIFDVVVIGVGLGFACQTMVTAVKFLPLEKSGMASGVINAMRQIGTCIGIALLVSILDTNIANAKIDMKTDAISDINRSGIAASVKTVAIKDITAIFDNADTAKQKALQTKLTNDVKDSLTSLSSAPRPADNETLQKLYDGASSLSDGAKKVTEGQKSLNGGIGSLSSGLGKLQSGSGSLTSGLGSLDSGLSQVLSGAQTLNSSASQGLGALSSGIGQLNSGAQQMLSQFSSGGSGGTTVYDGVTGVAGGAQSLSSNLSGYVSSVNNTYYLMIKNDPSSPQLLIGYKNSLAQAEAAYAQASGSAKTQDEQQAEALANLVALYTAGTDTSVTNETQFEAKLESLVKQSESNQNVVAAGSQITSRADQLSGASRQVAAQFKDGGAFKNGMEQLAGGTAKLNQSAGSLSALQQGIGKLFNGLLQLKNGSGQLLSGSKALQSGISSAKSGADQLQSGSDRLADADSKLNDGAAQLASGVGLAGQESEIQNVMNNVTADKNSKIADSFDKVFLLAAIILAATCFIGIFTDRKESDNTTTKRNNQQEKRD